MRIKILILLTFTMFISGCSRLTESPYLEDLALVGVLGYDRHDEDKLMVTMAIPQYEVGGKTETKIFKDVVDLTHEALQGVSKKSDKTVNYGQLRAVIVGEEFAQNVGLMDIILQLYRDPEVGNTVYIAVVKGRAEDFLEITDPGKMPVSNFLTKLLRPRKQTFFNPFTTIHDFVFSVTDEVADPMLPYLEKSENDIEITKIALFKDDKMVEAISPWEATLMYGLLGRKELASIKVPLEEETSEGKKINIMLEFVESSTKWVTNKSLEDPYLKIKMHIQGSLYGYSGKRNLENPEELESVEEEVSRYISKTVENIFKRVQDLQIDPIRSGQRIRASYHGNWTKEKWREAISKAKFEVEVDTRILSTGTLN